MSLIIKFIESSNDWINEYMNQQIDEHKHKYVAISNKWHMSDKQYLVNSWPPNSSVSIWESV